MNKYLLIVVAAAGFCAYAQNANTFTDSRDGKTYKTVKIGTTVWMAENLNYAEEGSKCYEDSPDSCAKYGRLYDYATANKACPAGWRLPSAKEWTALVDYAGGPEKAGTKLKSLKGWESEKGIPGGTNDYGFSALPGGYGDGKGNFYSTGYNGMWWRDSGGDCDSCYYARCWNVYCCNVEYMDWDDVVRRTMISIRCVED